MANAPEIRDTYRLKDKTYIEAKALPTVGAAAYSVGFDIGALTAKGVRLANMELELSHPALAVGLMVNADTLAFDVVTDTVLPIDGSSVVVHTILTALGAGGVGCAAGKTRYKVPTDFTGKYLGIACTHVGTGAPQTADMTVQLLF